MSQKDMTKEEFKSASIRELAEISPQKEVTVLCPIHSELTLEDVKNWLKQSQENLVVDTEYTNSDSQIVDFKENISNFERRLPPKEPKSNFRVIRGNKKRGKESPIITVQVKLQPIKLKNKEEIEKMFYVTLNKSPGIPERMMLFE